MAKITEGLPTLVDKKLSFECLIFVSLTFSMGTSFTCSRASLKSIKFSDNLFTNYVNLTWLGEYLRFHFFL